MIPFYINYCNYWIKLCSIIKPEIYISGNTINLTMVGQIYIPIVGEKLYNFFYKEYTLNKKSSCILYTTPNLYSAFIKKVQYSFNQTSLIFEVETLNKIDYFVIKKEFPILID